MKFQISLSKILRIFIMPIVLALLLIVPFVSQIGYRDVDRPVFILLILTVFLTIILVPNIYLLHHYYKFSNGFKVLFDNEYILCYQNSEVKNKILINEIERVHFVEFDNASFPSLDKFNYIRFLSKDGTSVIVTSIMYDGYLFDVLLKFDCEIKFIHKGFCTIDLKYELNALNNDYKSKLYDLKKKFD